MSGALPTAAATAGVGQEQRAHFGDPREPPGDTVPPRPGSWDTHRHPMASPCPSSSRPGTDPAPGLILSLPHVCNVPVPVPSPARGGGSRMRLGAGSTPTPHTLPSGARQPRAHPVNHQQTPRRVPAWGCAVDGAPQSRRPVCVPNATASPTGTGKVLGPGAGGGAGWYNEASQGARGGRGGKGRGSSARRRELLARRGTARTRTPASPLVAHPAVPC